MSEPPVVLFVSPDAELHRRVDLTLSREMAFLAATSGVTALRLVAARAPNVVIFDERTPDVIEGTFVESVRTNGSRTKVVILASMRGRRWPGVDGVLDGDPLDLGALSALIRTLATHGPTSAHRDPHLASTTKRVRPA